MGAQFLKTHALGFEAAGEVELEPRGGIDDELDPSGVKGLFFAAVVAGAFFEENVLVEIQRGESAGAVVFGASLEEVFDAEPDEVGL